MTSVEKRRSGRKSGKHRKHSEASSSGSFVDETDREVSNLTDRAFRSLCIGDEAVYNDSDLCSSSPCSQRDRQGAFSESGPESDRQDRERKDLKRAAHESFSLRMQQYSHDWIHGGMYEAPVHRDPQWEVYGERTQVSATFQHATVEAPQQEESLRDKQLSFLSNGAAELSTQPHRSRSRVSSLIRAFNSEGYVDGAGVDGKLREWNDETVWDKSALMGMQRDLSEFSTSYQQNLNSGHFHSAGPFSSNTNLYSSEIAAVAHINSESSFMRSSHSKNSMSTQVNCNSNFFIHSEFSPFKVWKERNRFPFQKGEVSGFLHCSEFSKWYETPMYKKLSLQTQPQVLYRFEERGNRYSRNNLAPVVPPTPSHATSIPTMPQKALAMEKRCESELAGAHRKWTENLETNRLPSQRPSTASPTIEMSRRVQDTISSVKALQQKIKMMTEQNITTGPSFSSNNNLAPSGNDVRAAPNVASSNTSTTPFNISQLLTPLVLAHQEVETTGVRQYAASPQPVEHPPVRAESRGATPDVRMSSYKSRATNLLFNLKDNRKRVKSTYSPTKFKGLETLERNKQHSIREPRDSMIDIPDFPDTDIKFSMLKESSRTNDMSRQHAIPYHNPGLSTIHSQPVTAHGGQYSEYTSGDYQPVQVQGEMVHHSGFTGFIPENCTSSQLANEQNLHEDLSSFTPYKQGMIDNVQTQGGEVYRHKPDYTAPETLKLNTPNSESREYLINKANTEQHFHKTLGKEFTKVDRHQQLTDRKHNYSNVSSQDRRGQTNNQETENISLKTAISPWKPEITSLMERDKHEQAYERAAAIKEEVHLPRDKCRRENQQSINKELEKIELRESFGDGTSYQNAGLVNPNILNQLPQNNPFSDDTVENTAYCGQQQHGVYEDKYALQDCNKQNKIKHNHQEFEDQQHFNSNKDKTILMQETDQRKSIPKDNEMQSFQPIEAKPQLEQIMLKKSLSNSDDTSAPTMANQVQQRTFAEVKAGEATEEHMKAEHAQEELTKPQRRAQVEMPKVESDRLILAEQTGSEKAKAEIKKHERIKHEKIEHIVNKDMKEDQTKQSRENHSDPTREEHTKTEQTPEEILTNKPKNTTEETGAKHMRGVQVEQVKAKQAEAERLKEEHIKNEPAEMEQTRIKQLKAKEARREKLKAEQVYEEQVRDEILDRERVEAEKMTTKEVKAEQAEAEHRKTKEANAEQIKEQQAKSETETTTAVEHDLIQEGRIKEQPKTHISKAHTEKVEERKVAQDKLEQTNVELTEAKLANTDNMQEGSAKSTAKVTQLVESVPDKVEQVKTELAKAKAELVKIKEKMRVEQKEKVRNATNTKEDGIKKNVLLQVNNEDKSQDQGTQKYQQRQDPAVVSRQSTNQVNRGADDYERLREKYGFTDTASTNRNKLSAEARVSLNEKNEPQALSLDKVDTTNDERSKDKPFPKNRFATTHRGNKEIVLSCKPSDVTESHYVYSESSKEFKLSSDDYLPTNVEVNVDSVRKLEKSDPLKHTHASQQRDSDLAKPLSHERKPKSSVHSVGPDSEPHLTPTRILSHKERAQTKQELLTSKIKAHAEKEISAIKERGFAIRDGIISKTFTKQLAVSQRPEAQRPPSQEASNKHESTMSSITIPKHQIKPSRTQMEPVKSVSSPTSAAIPVKSAAMRSQLTDHLQKKDAKETLKSNTKESNLPKEANQTETDNMSRDEGLAENQKKGNKYGNKAPIQSEERAPTNKQGYQESKNGETSGKQKETFKDNAALNTDHHIMKNEDSSQVTVLVKAEGYKNKTTEKAEKHGAVNEDSAPSLKLAFGQNETLVADDSLQIMGIKVSVRERKVSVNNGQSFQEQMNTKEREGNNTEIEKCAPSSGLEVSKGNEYPKEVSRVEAKARDVQNTNPIVKEDQTNVAMNNNVENFQETSALEIRQNTETDNVTVKWTEHQQGSSATSAQKETQVQEPLAEKGMPSTVNLPAKNKVSAESETLLYKQDMIARETKGYTNKRAKENSTKIAEEDELKSNTEEKNSAKKQTALTNENVMATVVDIETNYMNDSNRVHAITHDNQSTLKEDMAMVINPSSGRSMVGKDSSVLEEKRHDSTSLKPYNKTSPSNHLTGNENIQVALNDQCKEAQVGGNNQVENNVHIGSIAIRAVPAGSEKHSLKLVGKNYATPVFSDVAAANEPKHDATSSQEEKENTLNNEDRTKNLTPASSETKDIFDDKLGNVLSSVEKLTDAFKISNKQSSIRTNIENTDAENGKPEEVSKTGKSVDESNIRRMEGDYFQMQGVVEKSHNHKPHSGANVGDTSAVSKRTDFSRLNKATISNESYNEGKNEVFALDQDKMKTMETSLVSAEDEITERKNRETQGNLASKQSDGPTERQSNENDKEDAGRAIHITKQHTENQSSVLTKQQQRERNPFPTREDMVREMPEVKPKPKERLSTIPEISAIADYARLKVIVSEDRENTIQEFPRNKKEGFFPLIQSRHSRRPVFTADPVKEKSFPNKAEVTSKVNKEPKPIVFPITEKEHQRTGMFKLGDKERQEKMPLDAKANEYEFDTGVKHAHIKDRDRSPTTYLKNQGREEQVTATNNQRVCQVDQRIHKSNNLPFQAAASSEINRTRNTFVSHQLQHIDNTYPQDKPDEWASNTETKQVYKPEESKQTTQRTNVKTENAPANITKERTEKVRQERVSPQLKRIATKQNHATSRIEVENRPEDMKIKQMIEESRASLAEEERRTAQREEERRAREREAIAIQIKQKREKQREAERRAEERKAKQAEEEKAAQKEEKIRLKQQEAVKTMKETEEKRIKTEEEKRAELREEEEQKIKNNEMRRRLKQQEEQRAAQEEQQRRAVQEEEQQRRAVREKEQLRKAVREQQQQSRAAPEEEQLRRAVREEEQQSRAASEEEQLRRAPQEEQHRVVREEQQQRRVAQVDEQQKSHAQEEQKRRAAREEQQKRKAQEEEQQQRRAAKKEQQRRAAQEEQQMRAAQEEQQRAAAQEEQQRRVAKEEQHRRAAQEEQHRRATQEEQHRRAAQEEQQRRAAQEEQHRRAAKEEQHRRAAQEEQRRRAAQEEQHRRAAQEEQRRRAAQEEQHRRAAQEEQHRRAAQEEQQRRAAQEEQQSNVLVEEQMKAKQKILVDIEEGNKRKQREDGIYAQISWERKITQTKEKAEHQIEEQKGERQNREVWMRTQKEEEERRAIQKEKAIIKQTGENKAKEERNRILEESQAALKEEREAQEQMFEQRQDKIRAKKREEEKEKIASYREKERAAQMEEQKRGAQIMDALQYYTIASTEPERKPRERQPCPTLPSPQRNNSSAAESTDVSHTRLYRPHTASSPAPSLPRSNTSSPALGAKPSMFRVKDNTIRGSSFIKSVKPRFHKNFGEDFRVGSPMGSERVDEEQDTMRHSVVTPLHLDTGLNRLTTIKESPTFQPPYSSQDYTAHLPHHRPYSRRSIALEDDDSRSVISNMSEDVESFATSGADLADVRGLYDYERPESSCSFSSDVCRSLGKPPTVPPKSEKALRRAKRLTTRRIKKELSKTGADNTAGVEKPFQEGSSFPSSSSTEVRSSGRHAVATPHFSPPVSLARAPKLESGLPSSQTEHQSSRSSVYASPHATGPISLPNASPYAAASVSLPAASPLATGPASDIAPKTIADVPSSPTLHHASTAAPVTKYHVESSYPHSYPLTQRKVLQDLGSGQYFVVDVPVQVKTKTFFDPETGKYVQLNVHESSKRGSQPQLQQTYLQPQLQPQMDVKPQQPLTQNALASKPVVLYRGYPGYPQSYQPMGINSVPHKISSAPMTLEQDQQSLRESHSHSYPATEMGQISEEHYYSPEKTPYMDTVNDMDKTRNTVYNTHSPYESFPECNTNSQSAGSSLRENDNSAHSQCRPRDIITMSELEDFMELSDW